MITPRWSTTVLFVDIVVLFILKWIRAKKAHKAFRELVLPHALIAGSVSIAFAREFFDDLPTWIEATGAILCSLLILMALCYWLVQLQRYLKGSWSGTQKR